MCEQVDLIEDAPWDVPTCVGREAAQCYEAGHSG